MKKWIGVFLVAILATVPAIARQGAPAAAQQRIHAAKVAYITDRLKLSGEQSAAFVPVYNEFEQQAKQLRKKVLGKYKGMDLENTDEATSKKYLDDNLEYQQQMLDLKRNFNDRFQKVITAQQLTELNAAEREFRQLLQQRLKQRRQEGGGGMRRGR